MKKFLNALAVLCCLVAPSCRLLDPDNPIYKQTSFTIHTGSIYDDLGIQLEMAQCLLEGSHSVLVSALVYDQNGQLVDRQDQETAILKPLGITFKGLEEGTYTLLVWQAGLVKASDNNWTLSGEDQLSTLTATAPGYPMSFAEAAGCAWVNFSVHGHPSLGTIRPKAIGSVVELKVDNLTEDKGFSYVVLTGNSGQAPLGLRLDPSLDSTPDRWFYEENPNLEVLYCDLISSKGSDKFFTLSDGENIQLYLWGPKEEGDWQYFYDVLPRQIHPGQSYICYLDMDRLTWQPPFFGDYWSFGNWIIQRMAGLLVAQPLLKWGCDVEEVEAYMRGKQWYMQMEKNLGYWDAYGGWHLWYYVAPKLTEQYLFETEDGKNLQFAMTICWEKALSYEQFVKSLTVQGYRLVAKSVLHPIELDFFDKYLSADGKTEAYLAADNDGYTYLIYQPAGVEYYYD